MYTIISGSSYSVQKNLNRLEKEQPDHKIVSHSQGANTVSVIVKVSKEFDVQSAKAASKEAFNKRKADALAEKEKELAKDKALGEKLAKQDKGGV